MSAAAWQEHCFRVYGDSAAEVLALAAEVASETASPKQVMRDLQDFIEGSGRPGTEIRSFQDDPLALDLLLRLSAASQFGFGIVRRSPGLFWEMIQYREFRQVWGRGLMQEGLERALARHADPEHRHHELIRYQHRHLLRILVGDLSSEMSFEAITAELSDLADVLIGGATTLARARVGDRCGSAEVGFVVLGMGKLGARELNYSSDIDLIFVYGDPGGDSGGDLHDGMRRLGTELIRILDEPTAVGRLYRVDMRLRPEGSAGELVSSFDQAVNYYYTTGRAWERQAMIKARPVGGELEIGDRLIDEIRDWIFPRNPAPEDLIEARRMRGRIEERADDRNIKAGAGGIRDIEFLVQSYQLNYGGRSPELQRRGTLDALGALADVGLISAADFAELEEHYVWLRMVEHRLQMWESRQLHRVPDDQAERRKLAHRCGYTGPDALEDFDRRLALVRERVRRLSEKHYLGRTGSDDAFFALINAEPAQLERLAEEVLGPFGFKSPRKAAERLRKLAREPFFVLSRPRTEQTFLLLLPGLLDRFAASPDPDVALRNFQAIVEAVGGRAHFYSLLLRRRPIRDLFTDLAGWANYPIYHLRRYHGLPDEILERLDAPASSSLHLYEEGRELIAGLRDFAPRLASLKAREAVNVAIRDLGGEAQDEICRQLTGLARSLLQLVLERCVEARVQRWGEPLRDDGRPSRFAILGLGKLGSDELSYASDMDVIFVCDDGGSCRGSDRGSELFWERVAQDLMRVCGEGGLYDVDPRLRPWGEQGPLVATPAALANYWGQPREIWERMAMTRARPVAGDWGLGREASAAIQRPAFAAPLPDDSLARLRDMRARLEESVAGEDNIKRGWGGYVDIEFLAHYFAIARLDAETAAGRSIAGMLDALAAPGVFTRDNADALAGNLALMRRIESRVRLYDGNAISYLPKDPAARAVFARCCDYPDAPAMDLELHLARESTRAIFERLTAWEGGWPKAEG